MKTRTGYGMLSGTGGFKASAWWARFFQRSLQQDWSIPWSSGAALDAATKARIAHSIAEFQRGESSEARSYLAKSARFSVASGDPAFHTASVVFVATENAHADLLLRFMNETGIARRKSSFADAVFRRLRGFGDLGWTSRALIVAELIAQEYYPCLGASTAHPALGRICRRIISEEAAHIRFQVERIVRVEAAVSMANIAWRDGFQRVLMTGAACVVYLGHRSVLSVQLDFRTFLARALARNRRALAAMSALRRPSPVGAGARPSTAADGRYA